MLKPWINGTLVLIVLLAGGCAPDRGGDVVNVYSHRHYAVDQALFAAFTAHTGIRVNVVNASADELIQRLRLEGARSPADVLITVDAGRLHRARTSGLLQPVRSSTLERHLPPEFRDPQGYWFGLTYRARILAYSRERVDPADLSTYEALTDARWRGRLLVRSSENIYNQSLLASLIVHHGMEGARDWAKGVLHNMARPPRGNDRDQIRAIAAGEGDVALVNTYYIGIMLEDANPEERKAAERVGVFFPNQRDRGTHINISGAGVTRHAPNRDHAIRLLEFLSDLDSQRRLAGVNHEYPVNPRAERSARLASWGEFRPDTLDLSLLGENHRHAVMIFDAVGWK